MEAEKRVVGVKQSRKAIREGRALRVCLACDADPAITEPIAAECAAAGIPLEMGRTMAQLGRDCGIAVGAAVWAVVRD
ncbi:ribosomal L7Ae/L30e/S12e/Gadd45 family protein [Oscillospiraceae bacterium 38-13]